MERHDLDDHGSFAWLAHPDESMERASTAVALGGGGSLLVDPLERRGSTRRWRRRRGARGGHAAQPARPGRRAIAARHGAPRVFPRIMAARGAPIALPDDQERTVWSGFAGARPRCGCRSGGCWSRRRRSARPATTAPGDERLSVTRCCALPAAAVAGRAQPAAIGVGHAPLTDGPTPRCRTRCARPAAACRGRGCTRSARCAPRAARQSARRASPIRIERARRPCRPRAASPGTRRRAAVRCGCGCRR